MKLRTIVKIGLFAGFALCVQIASTKIQLASQQPAPQGGATTGQPGARGGGARGAGAPTAGARGAGPAAQNPNIASPAEFLIEPPTLLNLGFEWFIQGDENRDATVAVSYRKKGETSWKTALPMLRLKGERIYQGAQIDVIAPNMFAGSILDLAPDTAYEAQFVSPIPMESVERAAAS